MSKKNNTKKIRCNAAGITANEIKKLFSAGYCIAPACLLAIPSSIIPLPDSTNQARAWKPVTKANQYRRASCGVFHFGTDSSAAQSLTTAPGLPLMRAVSFVAVSNLSGTVTPTVESKGDDSQNIQRNREMCTTHQGEKAPGTLTAKAVQGFFSQSLQLNDAEFTALEDGVNHAFNILYAVHEGAEYARQWAPSLSEESRSNLMAVARGMMRAFTAESIRREDAAEQDDEPSLIYYRRANADNESAKGEALKQFEAISEPFGVNDPAFDVSEGWRIFPDAEKEDGDVMRAADVLRAILHNPTERAQKQLDAVKTIANDAAELLESVRGTDKKLSFVLKDAAQMMRDVHSLAIRADESEESAHCVYVNQYAPFDVPEIIKAFMYPNSFHLGNGAIVGGALEEASDFLRQEIENGGAKKYGARLWNLMEADNFIRLVRSALPSPVEDMQDANSSYVDAVTA